MHADQLNDNNQAAPTSLIVGSFIDSVAGKRRSPAAVTGRLIEEVVELGLSAGLTPGSIMEHVADALHNQSLKASAVNGKTVFPSQLTIGNIDEIAEECADVSLLLKDLCHVAKIDLPEEENNKWSKFIQKEFKVSKSGTIYAVKPHIKSDITVDG